MITLDQYFGKWLNHHDVTEEVTDNAEHLLDCVDKLMALAAYDNVPMPINPNTDSQVSGEQYGGFRPQYCPQGAPKSSHKQGQGVDIYDPDNHLDEWITDDPKVLEQCGLYREAPQATIGWLHLTTRAPGSGHRTFFP